MITLKDSRENRDFIKSLSRLESRPKLKWHHGFYDGPLSGICLYNDKEHWFDMVYEFDYEGEEEWEPGEKEILLGRVFVVAELTNEQFSIIKDRHEIFRQYVGCHTDYNDDGRRPYMSQPNGRALIEYDYNKYKEIVATMPEFPNLSNNEVVAWWVDSQLSFDALIARGMK